MVPGRRFSTTMSARSIKRRNTSFPRGSLRSRARERLLRLSRMKLEDSPSRNGAVARTWSPPSGFSIFTTSAPRSASWSVQNGAAMKLPTSTTRTPSSADSDMALLYTGAPHEHHHDSAAVVHGPMALSTSMTDTSLEGPFAVYRRSWSGLRAIPQGRVPTDSNVRTTFPARTSMQATAPPRPVET